MKTAIVTGASKGVGYATVKLLSESGYKVIAVSRNLSKVSELISENVEVYQLDSSGSSVKNGEFKLINCWPSDISTIDLSYDTTDTVEEFTITWTYDYWITGNNAALT